VIAQADESLKSRAFATIIKNRVNRGGILANGASFIKNGENGKGITSRWYPETLRRRILAIAQVKDKIDFIEGGWV
jgi:DNA adenine methylase